MNIVIITYYNKDDNNGICSYCRFLSDYLSKVEDIFLYMVHVCSPETDKFRAFTKNNITFIDTPYDLVPNKIPEENDFDFIDNLLKLLNAKSVTTFHLNWMNHAYIAPVLKKTITNCKIILTKHCVSWREYIIKNYSIYKDIELILKQKKESNVFVKRILRDEISFFSLVDHVITVTDDAKRIVNKLYGIDKKSISRVYNGITPYADTQCSKKKLRERYGFSHKDKIILFVGKLIFFKGLHLILPIIEKLSAELHNLKFIICGRGYFHDIMQILPESLSGKVFFLGNKSKKALEDFYHLSDLGILPSLEEQCSYVLLEMMRAGLPVIISDIPGLREILPKKLRHNFMPISFNDNIQLDEEAVIGNIMTLLTDKLYISQYKNCAKFLINTRFSAAKMCSDTLSVYNKISNQTKSSKQISSRTGISVIIPCYNAEKTIKGTVESVLNQIGIYKLEVIIVDDCSIDASIKQLESIRDNRIKIIKNNSHKGIVWSLNKGVQFSKNEYISRIDAGDIMLPERLAKQAHFLDTNTTYSLVGSNMWITNENLHITSCICYPENNNEIKMSRLFLNPFGHPSVMVRRDVFNTFKYENKFPFCEDYHLWNILITQYKTYNIQEFLTLYRVQPTSISSNNSITQHKYSIDLMYNEISTFLNRTLSLDEAKAIGAFNIGAPIAYWEKHEEVIKRLIHNICEQYNIPNPLLTTSLIFECAKSHLL